MAQTPEGKRPEARLSERQARAFSVAKRAAQQVIRRRLRVLHLVRDAYGKLFKKEEALGKVKDDLLVMMRMARSWARREYRSVPWKSLLYVVAAIVYFVNPVDLIPDVIAGLGFVDDVAVIGAVVAAVRNDLDAFTGWETQRQLPDGGDGEA